MLIPLSIVVAVTIIFYYQGITKTLPIELLYRRLKGEIHTFGELEEFRLLMEDNKKGALITLCFFVSAIIAIGYITRSHFVTLQHLVLITLLISPLWIIIWVLQNRYKNITFKDNQWQLENVYCTYVKKWDSLGVKIKSLDIS